MSDTTHFHFPLIAEAQSNKFITHNDAISQIDTTLFTISGGFVVPAPGLVYSDGTTLDDAAVDATLTFSSGVLSLTLDNVNAWTAAQRATPQALTSGSSIAVDLALSNNFSLTLAINTTLSNPTNANAGQSGVISIKQDGTGGRTMAFGSNWKFSGGVDPTLSTGANATDILSYYVVSSTFIAASFAANFS